MEFNELLEMMNLQNVNSEFLLNVALPVSLGIIMFSLGLGLRFSDFARVAKRPAAFSVGAANQLITLPLIAFIITLIFSFPPALAVGFMILALCPGGVTTNIIARLGRGDVALSVSLTAVISLLSIVTVPFLVAFFMGLSMGSEPVVDVSELGLKMFAIVAVPVLLGMVVRSILRGLANPVEKFFTLISTFLFVIIICAALYASWDAFIDNLPILGPALVILNLVLLFLGWASAKFMKLTKDEAATIAIETGVQNGTLGIAVGAIVAGSSVAGLSEFALPSAVYGVTMYLVTLPIVYFRRLARG
ncbi:MAG: bile acid:sodium symporter family protein [Nitratireductor sp.]